MSDNPQIMLVWSAVILIVTQLRMIPSPPHLVDELRAHRMTQLTSIPLWGVFGLLHWASLSTTDTGLRAVCMIAISATAFAMRSVFPIRSGLRTVRSTPSDSPVRRFGVPELVSS